MSHSSHPRRVAIVTGTRAEFGLLEPVMCAIADEPRLALITIVTGTHLTTDSIRDIQMAGFHIDHRVVMQKKGEAGRVADVGALARGIAGFGNVFSASLSPRERAGVRAWDSAKTPHADLPPRKEGTFRTHSQMLVPIDVVLVLGDRIEAFAAATAAHLAGLHVAHIHGGDRAEGVADESMRHAISKLAHIHFPATAESRKRLVRMGEVPDAIFRVGSPAMDAVKNVQPAADARMLIVLQHPIGETDDREAAWMAATLAATAAYPRLVMMPNHDPGRDGIVRVIAEAGLTTVDHLPRGRFLSLLKGAKAIVGNSSAGLIEAAALGTAAVNIGPRQAGRQRPATVIDCNYGKSPVGKAIRTAMKLDTMHIRHPYGRGDAGKKIARILATVDLTKIPQRKHNTY